MKRANSRNMPLRLGAGLSFLSLATAAFAQVTQVQNGPVSQVQTVTEIRTVTTQTETQKIVRPVGRMKAAIFIVNRAGKGLDEKIDVLNDMLTTRLTEKGFSILDRKEVMRGFMESREQVEQDKELKRLLTIPNAATKVQEADFSAGVADATEAGSALRVAQLLGADYLVVASLNSLGKTTNKLSRSDLGVNSSATVTTLRISLKVQDGSQGGSLYGDMVTVAERESTNGSVTTEDTDALNRLMDAAAVQITENITKRLGDIHAEKAVPADLVDFTIKSNANNVVVKLDGVVVGSTGAKLKARPGLHNMEVQSEWLRPWRNQVNIQAGMELNVQLELSDAGRVRFKDMKGFEAALRRTDVVTDTIKEQSAADAYAKKQVADGEKKFLENSSMNIKEVTVQKKEVEVINVENGRAAPSPVIQIQNQNNQ